MCGLLLELYYKENEVNREVHSHWKEETLKNRQHSRGGGGAPLLPPHIHALVTSKYSQSTWNSLWSRVTRFKRSIRYALIAMCLLDIILMLVSLISSHIEIYMYFSAFVCFVFIFWFDWKSFRKFRIILDIVPRFVNFIICWLKGNLCSVDLP